MGSRLSRYALLLAGLAAVSPQSLRAAESKSYVVDWFYMANYYGGPEDCPKGLNPAKAIAEIKKAMLARRSV